VGADGDDRGGGARGAEDAALGERLRAGDRAAFDAILDRYEHNLAAFVVRIVGSRDEAEELMPDVWLQIWLRRDTYDPARGALWTWMTRRVARGIALTYARARQRRLGHEGTASQQRAVAAQAEADPGEEGGARPARVVVADGPTPAEADEERRRRVWLEGAVAALPEAQREAMEAALFEGTTAAELAARTGDNEAAVSKRMQRGLESLKAAWRKLQDGEGPSGETS
jgi:RNA polymerase sigma-70 factor (ECF subfamily)